MHLRLFIQLGLVGVVSGQNVVGTFLLAPPLISNEIVS